MGQTVVIRIERGSQKDDIVPSAVDSGRKLETVKIEQ